MQTSQFEQAIGDLANTLGDPTRRGIYVSVREAADPITAAQIASLFGIHPNVARHHLDRLVEAGYLQVSARTPARSGAGRPAKGFEATNKEIMLTYPARRYDLLAELLARVVARLDPEQGPAVAEEIGRAYGRDLAAEVGMPDEEGFDNALIAVARALLGAGFEVSADGDERLLLTRTCPFSTAAAAHPEVVCRLDRGIVAGLLESARDVGAVHPHPADNPDGHCATRF